MYVVKSTVTLGKTPPIINLDDESNISEDDIELVTIEDSIRCASQSAQLTNVESVSGSIDKKIEPRNQSETVVDSRPNVAKVLPTRNTKKSDHALGNFHPLDVQHLGDFMCNTKPATEAGVERQQLCNKLPNVGQDSSTTTDKKHADTVRQPLKDAKNNPDPRVTSCASRGSSWGGLVKRPTVENSCIVKLPTLDKPSAVNSSSLQSWHVNETTLSQKNQNERNCGEENTNKAKLKVKVGKKVQKRKADSAGIVDDVKARPSKATKCVPDDFSNDPKKLNIGNCTCGLQSKQTVPNSRTKSKDKAKTNQKKRKKARVCCKTNKGKQVAAVVESPAVEVPLLSPTNEFQSMPADDSVIVLRAGSAPNTIFTDKLGDDQNAPLGSCVNPIIISDLSFSHQSEKKSQASSEKPCSENQEAIIVHIPEIEILDMITPSSPSVHKAKSNTGIASRKILLENSGKKVPCSDVQPASEKIPSINHITLAKPPSQELRQYASNLQGKPTNGHVRPSSFLFGDQPAGPCLVQSFPPVFSTFKSLDSAFGLRRTIANDAISNSFPPGAAQLAGSSLQYLTAAQNICSTTPAMNAGNIWPSIPLLDPSIAIIQWTNLLAEQAELQRRASANAASNGFPVSNKLRPIAIDGSNVAFSHGKDKVFSTRGIKICIDYFMKRGHIVKAFVPQFRRKAGYSVKDQPLLETLGKSQHVVFTPSRDINGVNVACYDDRFVLEYAARTGAVIVSNDNYRDLMRENQLWKEIINTRLLMYSFADDHFLVPEDPLGRMGPRLDQFLQF